MELHVMVVYLPIAGALIGLATKWAAIKLMFHPATFVGIGPIGWQGIVQRRSPKFAAGVADTITGGALSIDTLLQRLDGDDLAAVIRPVFEDHATELSVALLDAARPGASASSRARDELADRLPDHSEEAVRRMVVSLGPTIGRHLDVRALVVDLLSGANADRLARLTRHVAGRELQWVIWYGGILGFGIGAVGILPAAVLERWWILPLVGAADGLINNFLAIQMIFRPFERTRYLGVFPYQGLFPARQHEIAREYGVMLAAEVLTPDNLFAQAAADAPVLLPEVLPLVGEAIAPLASEVATVVGLPDDEALRQRVLFAMLPHLGPMLDHVRPDVEEVLSKQLAVAATIETALSSMPKVEFERVLRGIFEEDEVTLILMGGVLGGAIGCVQAALLLALGLA
ncbi:MAG: hypothetical protein Q8K58_01150 [Acidimicrobiales bacterium]|nr:hypothetical protein [Acidimicrobiales bacterium]